MSARCSSGTPAQVTAVSDCVQNRQAIAVLHPLNKLGCSITTANVLAPVEND